MNARGQWSQVTIAACVYAALALLLAWQAGAFHGSWGSDPDEASHFLNGVMVLDYAKAGLPGHPLRYAENYYQHYPKIGLGHWPPLFAIVEAAWFLAAPVGYGSAIVLVNLLAAAVATLVWGMAQQGLGLPAWLAWACGSVWLLLPLVRQYSVVFMAEMLLTLCVTAAVLAFARQSSWFGVWSAFALLTKGTGIALAPLPVAASLLRWDLRFWRQRWVWVSGLLVVALTAGWYLRAPGARHERVAPYGGIAFMPGRLLPTFQTVVDNLGPGLAVAVLVGLALAWKRRREDRLLLALLAFLPAHVALRMVVGAWETRHLVMVMPSLLLLAAVGLQAMRVELGRRRGWVLVAVVGLGTLANVAVRWPVRVGTEGFGQAAAALSGVQRLLVVATVPAEGAFIGSVALGDEGHRPARTVERGTKVLVESDFLGRKERTLVNSAAEVGGVLDREAIDGVVLDGKLDKAYGGWVREYVTGAGWERVGLFGGRAEAWVRNSHKGHKGLNVPNGH